MDLASSRESCVHSGAKSRERIKQTVYGSKNKRGPLYSVYSIDLFYISLENTLDLVILHYLVFYNQLKLNNLPKIWNLERGSAA